MGGMGTSTSNQTGQTNQTQNFTGQRDPWAAAMPGLQQLLGGIGGQFGNISPTGQENAAFNTLDANAANQQNFAPQATAAANYGLSGGGGILNNAYATTQNTLNPYLQSNYLDPTKTPGMAAALQTVRDDVTNNTNAQFAGAGRDLSGANSMALGRGIASAEAPLLLGQYNQNVGQQMGALGQLNQAAGNTLQGNIGANTAGLGMASSVPGFQNSGAMASLDAANMRRMLPLSGLGALSSLLLPIAGLGGTSSGTGQSTGQSYTQGSQTASPLQQLLMGSQAAGNMGNLWKMFTGMGGGGAGK